MTHRGTVLSTIQDKLNNPSPDDPFEPDIAAVSAAQILLSEGAANSGMQLMKNDEAKFLATAKEWTKKCVSASELWDTALTVFTTGTHSSRGAKPVASIANRCYDENCTNITCFWTFATVS